jgi:hypothetical protein
MEGRIPIPSNSGDYSFRPLGFGSCGNIDLTLKVPICDDDFADYDNSRKLLNRVEAKDEPGSHTHERGASLVTSNSFDFINEAKSYRKAVQREV